jgi:lysophospholipase L1-like esterase
LRAQLEARFPGHARVTNCARWGGDVRWGLAALADRVLGERPDVILLEFGINDADRRRGIALDRFRADLSEIVERIAGALPAAAVLLLAVGPALGRHRAVRPELARYREASAEVARGHGRACVDPWAGFAALSLAAKLRYLPDGIHPGAEAAQEMIVPAVMSALQSLDSKRARP